jgi:hypothetical protein
MYEATQRVTCGPHGGRNVSVSIQNLERVKIMDQCDTWKPNQGRHVAE